MRKERVRPKRWGAWRDAQEVEQQTESVKAGGREGGRPHDRDGHTWEGVD